MWACFSSSSTVKEFFNKLSFSRRNINFVVLMSLFEPFAVRCVEVGLKQAKKSYWAECKFTWTLGRFDFLWGLPYQSTTIMYNCFSCCFCYVVEIAQILAASMPFPQHISHEKVHFSPEHKTLRFSFAQESPKSTQNFHLTAQHTPNFDHNIWKSSHSFPPCTLCSFC